MLRTLKNIEPESLITDRASRQRELLTAMRGGSNYTPLPKRATARGLSTHTVISTLSEILKVQNAHFDELYQAMDALSERQQEI
jgi:hypothetical protein